MSAANYQQHPSDILEERVDSAPVLTDRLVSWHHAVGVVLEYAEQEYAAQSSVSSHLAKQRKTVNQIPSFSGASVTGGSDARTAAAPSAEDGVSGAFLTLSQQNDVLLRESESAAQSIKASVIPALETLYADLEKHHKTLKTQGAKAVKEIEKSRDQTGRYLEALGRATAAPAHAKPDPRNDPYVLHRRVRSVAAEQIYRENQHAESNLNTQNNFGSLEQHAIGVIQHAVAQLDTLRRRYYQAGATSSQVVEQAFSSIDPAAEWQEFLTTHSASLVPVQGFQRDPARVTFANSDNESTKPLIEGMLTRKGTVLKGKKPGYYVLSPQGFLYEFKSADYVEDPHPELSLYIPESQIGGIPQATSGELSFKLSSKDAGKVIGARHKYTFIASSYEELEAWHQALTRVAGATATELEGEDDDLSNSSKGVPAAGFAGAGAAGYEGASRNVSGSSTVPSTAAYEPTSRNVSGAGAVPGAAGATGATGAGAAGAVPTTTAPTVGASTATLPGTTPPSAVNPADVPATGTPGVAGVAGAAGASGAAFGSGPTHGSNDISPPSTPSTPGYSHAPVESFTRGIPTSPPTANLAGLSGLGAAGAAGAGAAGLSSQEPGSQGLEDAVPESLQKDIPGSVPQDLSSLQKDVPGSAPQDFSSLQKDVPSSLQKDIPGSIPEGVSNFQKDVPSTLQKDTTSGADKGTLGTDAGVAGAGLAGGASLGAASASASSPSTPTTGTPASSKRRSQVPRYQISPTKAPQLDTSFGAVPIEQGAEEEAASPALSSPSQAHRHDPAEGLPAANAYPRSNEHFAAAAAAGNLGQTGTAADAATANADTPAAVPVQRGIDDISKPISSEPFSVVYPDAAVNDEVTDEKAKYGHPISNVVDSNLSSKAPSSEYGTILGGAPGTRPEAVPESLPKGTPEDGGHIARIVSSDSADFPEPPTSGASGAQSGVGSAVAGAGVGGLAGAGLSKASGAEKDGSISPISDTGKDAFDTPKGAFETPKELSEPSEPRFSTPGGSSDQPAFPGSLPENTSVPKAAPEAFDAGNVPSGSDYASQPSTTAGVAGAGVGAGVAGAGAPTTGDAPRTIPGTAEEVTDTPGPDEKGFYTPRLNNEAQFKDATGSTPNSPHVHQHSTSHYHARTTSAFSQDTGARLDPSSSKYEGVSQAATNATGVPTATTIETAGAKPSMESAGFTGDGVSASRGHPEFSNASDFAASKTGDISKGSDLGGVSGYGSSTGAPSGTGATSDYGAASGAGAGATGVGAVGAGAGAAGSGSSDIPGGSNQAGYGSFAPSGGQAGTQGGADYGSFAPAGGNAAAAGGSGAGASGSGAGAGATIAGVAGGVGTAAGVAGEAGVPYADEVGNYAGKVSDYSNNGLGGAANDIPGMDKVNEVKQLAQGNAGGAAKSEIPHAKEASQFVDTAKQAKAGDTSKVESKAVDTAESKAVGSEGKKKIGLGKKIANVFK